MKRKTLRISKIDCSFSLTTGEIKNWLTQSFQDDKPIVLKCNGKNYRLASTATIDGKPVLIGRRGKRDS